MNLDIIINIYQVLVNPTLEVFSYFYISIFDLYTSLLQHHKLLLFKSFIIILVGCFIKTHL